MKKAVETGMNKTEQKERSHLGRFQGAILNSKKKKKAIAH